MAFSFRRGDMRIDGRLDGRGPERTLHVGDRALPFRILRQGSGEFVLELDGRIERVEGVRIGGAIEIAWRGRTFRLETHDEDAGAGGGSGTGGGDGRIRTPMPGKIVAVHVVEGDVVDVGQPLLVLESMKMQNDVASDVAGTVQKVHAELGSNVEFGDVLVEVTPAVVAGGGA